MRIPFPILRLRHPVPLMAALLLLAAAPGAADDARAPGTGDAAGLPGAPLATAPLAHDDDARDPSGRFLRDAGTLRETRDRAREAGRSMAAGRIAAPHHAPEGTTFELLREDAAPLRFRATAHTLILIRAADGLRIGKPHHLRAGWRCEAAWDLPPSSDGDMDKAPRNDGDAILPEHLIADPAPR